MFRAKICGNRSEQDVRISVAAGADAVGLISGVRHFSEDAVSADEARRLMALIPVFVTPVLVTHLITAREVLDLHEAVPTPVIQLHDDIPVMEIEAVRLALPGVRLIKAIHVSDASAIDDARAAASFANALLPDTRVEAENRIGGTGRTHDWSLSRAIAEAVDVPVILAGGLNPDNVASAIDTVRPFAVDVNSGVDDANGDKDPDKARRFIANAKGHVPAHML